MLLRKPISETMSSVTSFGCGQFLALIRLQKIHHFSVRGLKITICFVFIHSIKFLRRTFYLLMHLLALATSSTFIYLFFFWLGKHTYIFSITHCESQKKEKKRNSDILVRGCERPHVKSNG